MTLCLAALPSNVVLERPFLELKARFAYVRGPRLASRPARPRAGQPPVS